MNLKGLSMTINKKTRVFAACLIVILVLPVLSGCKMPLSSDVPATVITGEDGLYINGVRVDMTVPSTGSYFYNQLTDSQKTIYTASLIAIEAEQNVFELVGVDCDEYANGCKRATEALLRDHPEIFWLDGGNKIRSTVLGVNNKGTVEITLGFHAYWEKNDIAKARRELDEALSELTALVDNIEEPYEKVKFLNGWLAQNVDYDRASFNSPSGMDEAEQAFANTTYGTLIARKTLCGGYACTTTYILNRSGVDTLYVTGTTSDGLHAWNLINLDGEYYHLDTTWSDDNENGNVLYSYFCLDDAEISLTHQKDTLFDYPLAAGKEYNYYRREGLYFDKYTFNSYNAVFSTRTNKTEFSVKFSSGIVLDAAVNDIIENSKFYKLDGMKGASTFTYTVDDVHSILTIYP